MCNMGLGLAACVPMLNPGYLERFFWGPRKRAENIETSKKKASTFFCSIWGFRLVNKSRLAGRKVNDFRDDHPIEMIERSCPLNPSTWGWIGRGWPRFSQVFGQNPGSWFHIGVLPQPLGMNTTRINTCFLQILACCSTRAQHLNCDLAISHYFHQQNIQSICCAADRNESKWIKMVQMLSFKVVFFSVAHNGLMKIGYLWISA